LLILALATGPAWAGWHTFAGNRAEVSLPADFDVEVSQNGTLNAFFGPGRSHEVEITLDDVTGAERSLRRYAGSKGLPVRADGGKVMMIDAGSDFRREGVHYRRVMWRVASGNSLYVIRLTAPIGDDLSTDLRDFLRGTVHDVIDSLRRVDR
jgi:hypothetical protein